MDLLDPWHLPWATHRSIAGKNLIFFPVEQHTKWATFRGLEMMLIEGKTTAKSTGKEGILPLFDQQMKAKSRITWPHKLGLIGP